jgi:NitT/TauT family transport system substrate-binding protein
MIHSLHSNFTRRRFLSGTSALGAASILGWPEISRAEPPPEINKIRIVHVPVTCLAPQYLAEELLHLEGFKEVEYKELASLAADIVADGQADMSMWGAPETVALMDENKSIVSLAGIHAGCWEVFAHDNVRTIREIKGKRVAVIGMRSQDHILLSSMRAYVGIDPRKDINWIQGKTPVDTERLFVDGRADAFVAFPPQPQELRARKIGHVIVNTVEDRPWSQYFCCLVIANRSFVQKYPVAAKRALRAYLKAADICENEPERAARYMVEKGYESRLNIALEVIKSLPYQRWREANPEDTIRFHALRLHEVGMIKTNPNKMIAQGTDWRFLNELKRELKA